MNFADFIQQKGRKGYRLGPIKGRATVEERPQSFVMKFTHPSPFGYVMAEMNSSNWFGVSVYHPDWIIEMPNGCVVKMSLQGMSAPYNEKYAAMFDSTSVKYMLIRMGETNLWETWSGEIPPPEVIARAMA